MTSKQAIEALKEIKERIKIYKWNETPSPIFIRLLSIAERAFGKDSSQYLFVYHYKLYVTHEKGWTDTQYENAKKRKEVEILSYIDSFIKEIELTGINREHKGNFMRNLSDEWLIFVISIIISVMVGLYYIGFYFGKRDDQATELELLQRENQKLKQSSSGAVTSFPKTNPVSDIDTHKNKNPSK